MQIIVLHFNIYYISSPQPLIASVYSQDISCYGYDNGLIDLDIVGGYHLMYLGQVRMVYICS